MSVVERLLAEKAAAKQNVKEEEEEEPSDESPMADWDVDDEPLPIERNRVTWAPDPVTTEVTLTPREAALSGASHFHENVLLPRPPALNVPKIVEEPGDDRRLTLNDFQTTMQHVTDQLHRAAVTQGLVPPLPLPVVPTYQPRGEVRPAHIVAAEQKSPGQASSSSAGRDPGQPAGSPRGDGRNARRDPSRAASSSGASAGTVRSDTIATEVVWATTPASKKPKEDFHWHFLRCSKMLSWALQHGNMRAEKDEGFLLRPLIALAEQR